jgi:hypothetical protein
MGHKLVVCATKRRKGERKEGGEKLAGNGKAYAGNRADPAAQADTLFVCGVLRKLRYKETQKGEGGGNQAGDREAHAGS